MNKTVKTKTNMMSVGGELFKNEGFKGLYKGLDAALLRQVLYTTVRLGLYRYISDEYRAKYGSNLLFIFYLI